VDDLDEVRDVLGYDRVNLIGGSYGTRVALSYLRRHPDRVRAAVIDGVAPTTMTLPLSFARDAERALDLLYSECSDDESCRTAFPDARRDLEVLADGLARSPAHVSLPHPRSGELVDLSVSRDVFVSSIRGLLYSTEVSALLPLLVKQALAGDFAPFVAQATLLSDALEETMSLGMFLSVICSEDIPRVTDEDILRETEGTLFGDRAVRVLREACGLWPRGSLPEGYVDPVISDAPVVVLSGDLDPVTPPRWGESVVEHLRRGRHIVVPGAAHGTLANRCIPKLLARFLEEADVADLDLGCIDVLHRPPFFVDFAGPGQ
jgi:pimeloyl-ACP methyl ester carboxylesterase